MRDWGFDFIRLPIAYPCCRGYYPGTISHYKAPWANKDTSNLPDPKWPGEVGGKHLSKAMLKAYYKPWIDLIQQGVGVHCGECGVLEQNISWCIFSMVH